MRQGYQPREGGKGDPPGPEQDEQDREPKANGRNLRLPGALVLVLVIWSLLLAIGWDYEDARKQSMEDRVELLEKRMAEKARPVIHIQRATVYNARGEIAVRSVDEDEEGGPQ